MSYNPTVQRIYRETIASYGAAGVDRREAVEAAEATVLVEVMAGRVEIDVKRAIRDELYRVDEADGRAADKLIEKLAYGEAPIYDGDLDVIVTLGAGMRKAWADVTPTDLSTMIEVRQENVNKVRAAADKFRIAASRIRETVFQHGTVGAAYLAGGFPPPTADREAGVA